MIKSIKTFTDLVIATKDTVEICVTAGEELIGFTLRTEDDESKFSTPPILGAVCC